MKGKVEEKKTDLGSERAEVLPRSIPGGNEGNHKNRRTEYSVIGPKFEPGTSRYKLGALPLEPPFLVTCS
jgi:hypothetical protein